MAKWQTYRTARVPRVCDDYPECERGIQPGERYMRATATPRDEDNNSDRWWTLNICVEHMYPETQP